jgi:hypothetical protein
MWVTVCTYVCIKHILCGAGIRKSFHIKIFILFCYAIEVNHNKIKKKVLDERFHPRNCMYITDNGETNEHCEKKMMMKWLYIL